MRIVEPGHVYELDCLDGDSNEKVTLTFVNRESEPHSGTQTQEVLRALIDRTQHCHSCLPWAGNDQIIRHLRMALALHEARAIERRTEKGVLRPELVRVDPANGHFKLQVDRVVG